MTEHNVCLLIGAAAIGLLIVVAIARKSSECDEDPYEYEKPASDDKPATSEQPPMNTTDSGDAMTADKASDTIKT